MNDTTEPRTIEETTPQPAGAAAPTEPPVGSFVPVVALREINTQSITASAENAYVRPVRRRGPAPFFTMLGFVVRDYFRSAWPLLNLAVLAIVHVLFLDYQSSRSRFFSIEYAMVVVMAGLTASGMFARANRAQTYAILARPIRRVTLTAAVLLASWLIAIFFHIVSTLIEFLRFGLLLTPDAQPELWRTPATYLTGMLPVMVAAAVAVGLIALLSSFVSSSGVRLGVLGALALLVMSFDSKNFPIESVRPFLQQLPPVLAPAAGALKFATDPQPDSIATASLGLLALYALLLLGTALWMSSQREVILD